MKAPFPYFGGKTRIADVVWRRFGNVNHYIEPFLGSGAVLLARPHTPRLETVNDIDALLCCFWRAVKADPKRLAQLVDWPVSEVDLHARHQWLIKNRKRIREKLIKDPEWFDLKAASWWVWGCCLWIGSGWTRAKSEQKPFIGYGGRGVFRLGQKPYLRKQPQGIKAKRGSDLVGYFETLCNRFKDVRVCSGDWTRVLTDAVVWGQVKGDGVAGVFLDPPYGKERNKTYVNDSSTVWKKVRRWAIENGERADTRIALCGYEGEYDMPKGWTKYRWSAQGGFGSQSKDREARSKSNRHQEVVYFSPHCLGSSTTQVHLEPLF